MRILFLCASADLDFLQDIVFHGLVQLLGVERVHDYPQGYSYHGPAPAGSPYAPFYFDLPRPAARDLDDLIDDADAIVIGSLRPPVLPSVRHLLSRSPRPPVAFIDGEEDPYIRGIVEYVDVYFKSETLASHASSARIEARRRLRMLRMRTRRNDPVLAWRGVATAASDATVPLPFGMIDVGAVRSEGRRNDIAFLASPNTRTRARLIDALDGLRGAGLTVATSSSNDKLVPWDTYIGVLANSAIAPSLRGRAYNTLRYWEIPYAGALLLAEPAQIIIPNNFVDGVDAVFAPADAIPRRAVELLRTPEYVAELAARGRERVLTHHLSTHRAQTVLDRLESITRRRTPVLD